MSVAIIPARGGSKRIPGKNIRDFSGKPIIAYSIDAARDSDLFSRIIVSTDSEAIAEVAIRYGAEVPFVRPAELAGDQVAIDDVLLHALGWLKAHAELPTYACCIYPTAPFLQSFYLQRGLEILQNRHAISAIAITSFDFSPFRAVKIDDNDRLCMVWPEYRLTRSQDLPKIFHDAGQFFWVSVAQYMSESMHYGSNAAAVTIPHYLVNDIDTPEDWKRAELMYRALHDDAL